MTSKDQQHLIEQVDQLLPQTQCTKCGFQGCRPYAEAIVLEDSPINRCPPGGQNGITQLAALLQRPMLPLDVSRGEYGPLRVAVIDEQLCIGCTLCIAACPVDAILGAAKQQHMVVAANCSGCDLCIEPCPVDCIVMRPAAAAWTLEAANAARLRFEQRPIRAARIATLAAEKRLARLSEHDEQMASRAPDQAARTLAENRKAHTVAAALARARERRGLTSPSDADQ